MSIRHNALSILALLSFPLYSMETPVTSQWDPEWHKRSDEWLESQRIEGSSYLELKQVFESAPPFVKGTVEHLKDPSYYKPVGAPEYRFLMLNGSSGSGKSTLAKAIAMYAGWDLKFMCPDDFQNGKRGEAAQKLHSTVDDIISSNAPTVMVIEEINQILEKCESDNHDNDATSKALWIIMDKVHGNNNFFLVGTANRLHKIPKQVKTRIKARYCNIEHPKDTPSRLKIFRNILGRSTLGLNANGITTMTQILERNPSWNGRDFVEFSFKMIEILRDVWNRSLEKGSKLGGKIMGEAEVAMKEAEKEDLRFNDEELSSEERQDLYQAQNILTQVCIQRFQKQALFGIRTPGVNSTDGNFIIDNVFTEEMKRIAEKRINLAALKEARSYIKPPSY